MGIRRKSQVSLTFSHAFFLLPLRSEIWKFNTPVQLHKCRSAMEEIKLRKNYHCLFHVYWYTKLCTFFTTQHWPGTHIMRSCLSVEALMAAWFTGWLGNDDTSLLPFVRGFCLFNLERTQIWAVVIQGTCFIPTMRTSGSKKTWISLKWRRNRNEGQQAEVANAHESSVWDLAWHPMGHILCR